MNHKQEEFLVGLIDTSTKLVNLVGDESPDWIIAAHVEKLKNDCEKWLEEMDLTV